MLPNDEGKINHRNHRHIIPFKDEFSIHNNGLHDLHDDIDHEEPRSMETQQQVEQSSETEQQQMDILEDTRRNT